jgi:sterol 24-C-methyltransferase
MGCGVGGPARYIAKGVGCDVIGVNISSYQLERCRLLTEKEKLTEKVAFVQADFCNMPFKDSSLDGAYAIEATCHTDKLEKVFREAYRVLKPGCCIVLQDWFMTDKYDPTNKEHRRIKHAIEETNALPDLRMITDGIESLKKVGFGDIEHYDMTEDGDEPWYNILVGRNMCSLSSFRASWLGRNITHAFLLAMQSVGWAPEGTTAVHSLLLRAANELALAGKLGIFTPMYYLKARKPA